MNVNSKISSKNNVAASESDVIPPPSCPTQQLPGTNPPKRILFVDDEPLLRQLHQEALSELGFAVELAENGAAAWDALQLQDYDLMITDNDMPKVTGVELLEKLHAARIALPVIMVSGTMPTEELKRPEVLPVKATLHKPYAIADLLKTVNCILSGHQSCANNSPRSYAS
jgi:DNA-binding response OmpR family regulator